MKAEGFDNALIEKLTGILLHQNYIQKPLCVYSDEEVSFLVRYRRSRIKMHIQEMFD